jgi:hypothetical protein
MHLAVFPSIRFNKTINLITETLDNIVQKKKIKLAEYNCLVLDTQGSELEVLKGFQKGLGSIDIIVTEISIKKLYKNSVLFIQLKKWLENQNFILVASRIHQEIGDGDALFLKKDAAKILLLGKEAKHEISGRKFVFGILVRSILIKFLPGGLVSKIARKKTRGL